MLFCQVKVGEESVWLNRPSTRYQRGDGVRATSVRPYMLLMPEKYDDMDQLTSPEDQSISPMITR